MADSPRVIRYRRPGAGVVKVTAGGEGRNKEEERGMERGIGIRRTRI